MAFPINDVVVEVVASLDGGRQEFTEEYRCTLLLDFDLGSLSVQEITYSAIDFVLPGRGDIRQGIALKRAAGVESYVVRFTIRHPDEDTLETIYVTLESMKWGNNVMELDDDDGDVAVVPHESSDGEHTDSFGPEGPTRAQVAVLTQPAANARRILPGKPSNAAALATVIGGPSKKLKTLLAEAERRKLVNGGPMRNFGIPGTGPLAGPSGNDTPKLADTDPFQIAKYLNSSPGVASHSIRGRGGRGRGRYQGLTELIRQQQLEQSTSTAVAMNGASQNNDGKTLADILNTVAATTYVDQSTQTDRPLTPNHFGTAISTQTDP
ncbi:unnamed protein product, partial [Mesorhabditis spiculigera]